MLFLIISYVLSSTKLEKKRAEPVLPRSGRGGVGRREVAQTMYTYVSKCKNDKIKETQKKEARIKTKTVLESLFLISGPSYVNLVYVCVFSEYRRQ
jgi:hypothetical protein